MNKSAIDYNKMYLNEWTVLNEIKDTLQNLKKDPCFNYEKLGRYEIVTDAIIKRIERLEAERKT